MTLYIVATPIGNLKDITLRAIEILQNVDIIICEDTRKTGFLLKWIKDKIKPGQSFFRDCPDLRIVPFNSYNENAQTSKIIELSKQGNDIALVSNSGTPLINDPGFKLVRDAKEQGIEVIPIPGPSSILAALVASGLPTNKFAFLGFFPKKESQIEKLIQSLLINDVVCTYIAFVSPYNLAKVLAIFKRLSSSGYKITLASELTKIHENIETKSVGEWLEFFNGKRPKGEYVILWTSNFFYEISQKPL